MCVHFDPEQLRDRIGFVPQETFLFSATLAENIAWGVRMRRLDRDSLGGRSRWPGKRH